MQATLSVNTDKAAICRYATSSGLQYDSMPNTFSTTGSTVHSSLLQGLVNGTSYSYYVRCRDQAGNTNTADYAGKILRLQCYGY